MRCMIEVEPAGCYRKCARSARLRRNASRPVLSGDCDFSIVILLAEQEHSSRRTRPSVIGSMSLPVLRKISSAALWAVLASISAPSPAQEASREVEIPTAPVVIDGRELFRVRGVSVYPAEVRATRIETRIAALADDPSIDRQQVQAVLSGNTMDIAAGPRLVMSVHDADASIARIDRQTLATLYAERVRIAIDDYRRNRSTAYLKAAVLRALIATVIVAAALWLTLWLLRKLTAFAQRRYGQHVRALAIQSFQILHAQQIRSAVLGALTSLRYVSIAVIVYLYMHFVLSLFPWTRALAQDLLDYLVGPVSIMARGFMAALPDFIFLAILALVTRYLLRVIRLFFEAVGRGTVSLTNFEPDWAMTTYRIIRFGVVVFALIIAYPFIPGSGSEAFKGISIFLGVVFSIGSTSFISNLVAGYTLTYRRAFKVGDWVKIGAVLGEVVEIRVQVTHLRTLKNEEVILPNSVILNTDVVNYSTLARKQGLILHASVGIGYETSWRKVEAMLLLAAQRTPGLLQEPVPFVLQTSLGGFAITYEINAYCNDAHLMSRLRSALHRNILDVFNEYGVQIMTPAYESDPAEPKIVPRTQWHEAPAAQPATDELPEKRPAA
jgi:small-conductance mechanosensitive channel